MNITIVGATGFVGKALIGELLKSTDHSVRAFSKSANKLFDRFPKSDKFTAMAGDIFDNQALTAALTGSDVAVYLVHMMGAKHDDYAKLEARAATVFADAARTAGIKRIVFLGGLGDDTETLSKHLSSRQRTGQILREGFPLVVELRASMIIGSGSVGYEIIKAVAAKLPVTAVPRWANTKTQPIALSDAVRYIVAAIETPIRKSVVVGIGGPEVLTYPQILSRYTAWNGKRHHVFMMPFVPRWAANIWLSRYVSKKSSGIGRPMVESLHHKMVVTDDTAQRLFPAISPMPIEIAFC